MDTQPDDAGVGVAEPRAADAATDDAELELELIEEISIDGMCGVY